MYLIAAATDFELAPFLRASSVTSRFKPLITGIGPVEAALQATAFLAQQSEPVTGVINIGVAGAYRREQNGAGMLDICLANHEVLGDLGICVGDGVEPLRADRLVVVDEFNLQSPLLTEAVEVLQSLAISCVIGPFVTVNCVSGSEQRGREMVLRHQALCENMEGAALARVCGHFGLPLLELRCVSNYVEHRDPRRWRIKEACNRCGEVAAAVCARLSHD